MRAPGNFAAPVLPRTVPGSGYFRTVRNSFVAVTSVARVASRSETVTNARPGEPSPVHTALTAADSARELRAEVQAGRLDSDAVAAVLVAAGHPASLRREWPAGLTTREVDVLRLLARGLSSKQIATQLVISPKTARNHIEHIYAKIDASSRITASLFATEHGLL